MIGTSIMKEMMEIRQKTKIIIYQEIEKYRECERLDLSLKKSHDRDLIAMRFVIEL